MLERRQGAWRVSVDPIEIIHAGAAEGAVGHREAGRLDDMRPTPRQAHSRKIVPVFWGMSGS